MELLLRSLRRTLFLLGLLRIVVWWVASFTIYFESFLTKINYCAAKPNAWGPTSPCRERVH